MAYFVTDAQIHEYTLMNKIILLLIGLMASALQSSSQSYTTEKTASNKVQKLIGDAKGAILVNNLNDAITFLQKAIKEDSSCIDSWQMLGEVYFTMEQYKQSKPCFQTVLRLNPTYKTKTYYLLSVSSWNTEDYDECISNGTKFIQSKDPYSAWVVDVKRLMANSLFSRKALKNPVPFNPINLGDSVNTKTMDEYSPSVSLDNSILIFNRNVVSGSRHQEDFYISSYRNTNWSLARDAGSPLNTPNNEGAQKISADGNTLYFTVCNAKGGYGSCDLYTAQRNGDGWSSIRNLGYPVSITTWESQPSISADGNDLYFASNREGTYGLRDIFVSHKGADGKWGIPENLGAVINTPFDEGYPYIHPDNKTLYFCSDGLPGMGGIDIYVSRRELGGSWSEPVNLGYPINTRGDNTALVVSADGKKAYYSSTPDGRTDLDLYMFDLPETLRPVPVTYVKGLVKDKASGNPIQASVELIDLKTSKSIATVSSGSNGQFFHSLPTGYSYAFTITKPGYLFHSEHFELLQEVDAEHPFILNIDLVPVSLGSSVVLRNIFFDVNASVLKPESDVEVQKLVQFLKNNPTAKIEIGGHTDNTGSASANQLLSESRAKAVYEALVKAGIEASRLNFKGYGSGKPVADNTSEEGRSKNRRTEVLIISL